jgi:hypothetical protein
LLWDLAFGAGSDALGDHFAFVLGEGETNSTPVVSSSPRKASISLAVLEDDAHEPAGGRAGAHTIADGDS